ncbi:pheromone alpha factor receptor [Teratosphaeriaceae sp. CCFEE 6253]|nr:pheromone alpha factor receptor [Teratosphaeriaceae sp. CCFEE 6253]
METATWLNSPAASKAFDPYSQTFVLAAPDGRTAVPATVSDILTLNRLCVSQSIIFGTQLGVTGLLFTILMLMTKRDKRRSAVFLLNGGALLVTFIRNVLACVSLNSVFYNFYNWELYYYPAGAALRHAQAVNVATEVLGPVINALVLSSLVLQIRIVCCTLTHTAKIGITLLSTAVACAALAVRFALAVFNIEFNVLKIGQTNPEQFETLDHIAKANIIITVASIAFFSAIFVIKLAFAIHLRRKLNMKQFGPMQIIFVMGCQTMLLPLIFAVMSYYTSVGIQINSAVTTIVAVFLPLSGMWASAQTASEKLVRSDTRFHRAIPIGATDLSSAKAYGVSTKTTDTADTLIDDDDGDDQNSGSVPYRGLGHGRSQDSPRDVEMAEEAPLPGPKGVVVDRTYSVRSD